MATVRRGAHIKKFDKTKPGKKGPVIHAKNTKPTFGRTYKGKNNKFETATESSVVSKSITTPFKKPLNKKDFATNKNTKAIFSNKSTTLYPKKVVHAVGVMKPIFKKTPKLVSTLTPGLERLERAIAHMGLASRREAKDLIARGEVTVNGTIIKEPGFGIRVGKDTIEVQGAALAGKETVLVYKPRGLETNKTNSYPSSDKTAADKAKDLHDYFPKLKHLAPIGRLDKDSEGLIIMSNDGSLARALTQENSHIGKTYLVTVRENVTDDALQKMAKGIMLDKVRTKPAIVQRASRKSFTIVLHEGRKHQIRRMCDACHLNVEELLRTQICHLSIGTMKPGSSRKLMQDDIEKLKK